jgi:hypothetical protein
MPTRSSSKKTSAAAQKREVSSAGSPKEVQAAIARSIESRQSDDAAQRLTSLLGNAISRQVTVTPLCRHACTTNWGNCSKDQSILNPT